MSDNFRVITSDYVKVNVTNSQNSAVSLEQKFAKSLTIEELKNKLEIITGGCASTMQLDLYSGDKFITKLNDGTILGSYPIENDMRIHAIYSISYIAENVPKFEMSDEQYKEKQNTVRDFLKKNNLGKYNEDEQLKMAERKRIQAEEEERLASLATIGSRCMVTAKGPRRLGTVMYNGPLEGKSGIFIGVQFDEPLGVNDGTVNGKRYFECQPKYGSFVPVANVTIGDFPPENYDDEL